MIWIIVSVKLKDFIIVTLQFFEFLNLPGLVNVIKLLVLYNLNSLVKASLATTILNLYFSLLKLEVFIVKIGVAKSKNLVCTIFDKYNIKVFVISLHIVHISNYVYSDKF